MTEEKLLKKLKLWLALHPFCFSADYEEMSCEHLCRLKKKCHYTDSVSGELKFKLKREISPKNMNKVNVFGCKFTCIKWLDDE